MKRLASKAIAVGATVVGSSIAFATTVAAQTYSYDYTPYTATDAAAGGLFASAGIAIYCCIACIPLIILIALAYYVFKDAKKYEVDNAALWAALTFFTGIIGLLIYFLAIRPDAVKKMESKGATTHHVEHTEAPKAE